MNKYFDCNDEVCLDCEYLTDHGGLSAVLECELDKPNTPGAISIDCKKYQQQSIKETKLAIEGIYNQLSDIYK